MPSETGSDLSAAVRFGATSRFASLRGANSLGIILVYVALCAVFGVLSARFPTVGNFSIILGQSSAVMISAFAMTMVILSGGIDLSVGAIVALSGVTAAVLMQDGYSAPVAAMASICVAALIGLANGLLTVIFRVQPFLVTLGALSVARGSAELIAHGGTVPILDTGFIEFFAGSIGQIPVPAIWMVALLTVSYVALSQTIFGRRLYAIGGNEQAAIQAGTNVPAVKVAVYVISGAFAGVASMIASARLSAGLPGAGVGFELDVIAAVVLGGTGFRGEGGSVIGTLFGALIIGTVSNGLTLIGVDPLVQKVVKGGIILAAIIFEAARFQRRNRQ